MPLTTAPMPMSTGLRSMIRVSGTVSSVVGASKPGATIGHEDRREDRHQRAQHDERDEHEVDDAARQPPRLLVVAARAVAGEDGMSAALSAPATTSWKIASGMRKAAK